MRYVDATARPTIRSSSAGVFGRCEPVPLMMVTFRAGTWASSANSQGSSRSDGIGRVMSGITTATRSRAPTRSRSGRAPIGRRTASRNAAASSASPSTNRGRITVTSVASVTSSRPSVPYWRCRRSIALDDSVPPTQGKRAGRPRARARQPSSACRTSGRLAVARAFDSAGARMTAGSQSPSMRGAATRGRQRARPRARPPCRRGLGLVARRLCWRGPAASSPTEQRAGPEGRARRGAEPSSAARSAPAATRRRRRPTAPPITLARCSPPPSRRSSATSTRRASATAGARRVLPSRRQVLRAHRGPRRQARRVRDHLHVRRHAAPAVPRAVPRRPAPGARPRLGHAAPRRGRPALVLALSRHHAARPGSPPLDGAGADVELPVRRVPLDGPPEAVRPGDEPVRDDVGRAHRVVRGVPRAGLGPRRLGREAPRGRAARGARHHRPRRAPRARRRDVDHEGPPARHRRVDGRAADLGGGRRLRALPRAPPADRRSPSLRPPVPRHPRAGAPRGAPLPRGRADPGRGLRVGLVRPEPDAARGRHLLGLPRAASRDAAGPRQRRLRAVPPSGEVRRADAPPPCGRDRGRPLRELPHAGAHVHGGGSAAGPQSPHPAPRPVGGARHPERLQRLSSRSRAPVGRRAHRGVGRPRPRRRRRLRADARRRAARAPGRGAGADRARERPEPGGYRARDGALPPAGLLDARDRARRRERAPRRRRPGPAGRPSRGGRLARRPPGPPGGPPPSRPGESRAPRGSPDPRGAPARRGAARRLRSRARRAGPVGAGQRRPARGAPQSRESLRAHSAGRPRPSPSSGPRSGSIPPSSRPW